MCSRNVICWSISCLCSLLGGLLGVRKYWVVIDVFGVVLGKSCDTT